MPPQLLRLKLYSDGSSKTIVERARVKQQAESGLVLMAWWELSRNVADIRAGFSSPYSYAVSLGAEFAMNFLSANFAFDSTSQVFCFSLFASTNWPPDWQPGKQPR